MKLIRLRRGPGTVLVNPEQLAWVQATRGGTLLLFVGGDGKQQLAVNDSPEAVEAALVEAGATVVEPSGTPAEPSDGSSRRKLRQPFGEMRL